MITHFLLFVVNTCDFILSAPVAVKLLKIQALCFVERKLILDGYSDSLWIVPCRIQEQEWQSEMGASHKFIPCL